jgi:arsenate reductase
LVRQALETRVKQHGVNMMSDARRGHEKGAELAVNVLFVCVGNAGRSPMAEAFFRVGARGRYEVRSAGTRPAIRMGPNVVEAMRELGIDLSGHQPRQLERSDLEWADVVVRIGCGDACPVIPGRRYLDWEVQDPNQTDPGTTRRIRDEISSHVEALLEELNGESGPGQPGTT